MIDTPNATDLLPCVKCSELVSMLCEKCHTCYGCHPRMKSGHLDACDPEAERKVRERPVPK